MVSDEVRNKTFKAENGPHVAVGLIDYPPASGGTGLLIGGLAGGGAGTAAAGLTGNKDLDIPAESIVHFKLSEDLIVQP